MRRATLCLAAILFAAHAAADIQTVGADQGQTAPQAVILQAAAAREPASVTLTWRQPAEALRAPVMVFRKAPDDRTWRPLTASPLPAGTTQFVDQHIDAKVVEEYRVSILSNPQAHGFITSGIDIPAVETRGEVVLVVESHAAKDLEADLRLLMWDLRGDGWRVIRHDVTADLPPTKVRELVKADAAADPSVHAVYLFGHVAVPYSGNLAPDGHTDHRGAWPADGFYGDLTGEWTDATVNTGNEINPRQKNLPGDGKFDPSAFPATVALEVGRVDFWGMQGFGEETALLKKYIAKSHAYRQALRRYPDAALIADHFGVFHDFAFAASAWRSFPPLVGDAHTQELKGDEAQFIEAMSQKEFTWAYGCGPGMFESAGGVVTTDDFRKHELKAPFWSLFGSFFGDADAPNALLRAPLAGSDGLACSWSGFPLWQYHPMGLGQTIGYCARLTMNNGNPGLYPLYPGAHGVHICLQGDPTLRMHPIAPPTAVHVQKEGQAAQVTWRASADANVAYHVFRADSPDGVFKRLTTEPAKGLAFDDAAPTAAAKAVYMVRAVLLQTTPSGTYFDMSQGAFAGAGNSDLSAELPPAPNK